MPHAEERRAPPAGEEDRDIEIELVLDTDLSEMKEREEAFKQDVANDIAAAVRGNVGQVQVLVCFCLGPRRRLVCHRVWAPKIEIQASNNIDTIAYAYYN